MSLPALARNDAAHGGPPDDAEVAFRSDRVHRASEYRERVASLAAWLAKSGRGRWLLASDDAFGSAVAFAAIASARCCAVLAPNLQPETLRRLAAGARGALADTGIEIPALGERPRLAPLAALGGSELGSSSAARDDILAEFQTSGTTGAEKSIAKLRRHLDDEVAVLEALFGARLGPRTAIFATVAPQHIYGLLFRVLWPLASGRSFQADALLLPQELLPRMREREACALVTTPAHLRRMAAARSLREIAGRCRAVFSSGAPLDAATRDRAAEALAEAPIEILGSTETGGIAWRQSAGAFTPFPGVEIERDAEGRLVVTSAFASAGELLARGRRRFVTGDICEIARDGRIEIQGRADRVVKIAGKRLALDAMEAELTAHAWIEEAALCALPRGSELRVHAAIVASSTGREALRERGVAALREAATAHLADRFDRALLPRAWRVVARLPRNASGKLPAAALRALFESPREPLVVCEEHAAGVLQRQLELPAELACCDGHFPGEAIVPGVALLGWALRAGAELAGRELALASIDALKFPEPLRPGQRCSLRVALRADGGRLDFEIRAGATTCASGRCTLAAEALI